MCLPASVVTAGCPVGWCDSGPGNDGAASAGGMCAGGAERAGPPGHGRPGAPQGHHHQLSCPEGETAAGWGGSGVPQGQHSPPPSPQALEVLVPNFPADESRGFHKVPFQTTIYIEETDFREVSWPHQAILPLLPGAAAWAVGAWQCWQWCWCCMGHRRVSGSQLRLLNMPAALTSTGEMPAALSLAGTCPTDSAHAWPVRWGMSSSNVGL